MSAESRLTFSSLRLCVAVARSKFRMATETICSVGFAKRLVKPFCCDFSRRIRYSVHTASIMKLQSSVSFLFNMHSCKRVRACIYHIVNAIEKESSELSLLGYTPDGITSISYAKADCIGSPKLHTIRISNSDRIRRERNPNVVFK